MKYLLLLTNEADEIASWDKLSDEEKKKLRAAEVPKWNELFGQMMDKGQWLDGLELEEPKTAKSVRVRDGETIFTDGPYAETKEQIGGFFLVECGDLDEAIELAARVPVATKASVEIRPLVER
jgi:hypothetical protein